MTEFQKFKRRLRNHPGVDVAIVFTAMGAMAGASRPDGNWLFGLLVAGIPCWALVLVTSWVDREIK